MKPVPSRSHRIVRVCLLVALGGACGAEPDAPADPVAPRCADPAQAPIDDSRARNGCVTVGASGGAAPGEFADPGTPGALPSPIRYVRAGAAAGGDGSRERPFATLAEATAREPTGTLLLARGTHPVDAAARLRGAFAVVGAGVGVTTLRVTRGRAALEAVGAGQDGLVRGFTVEATAAGGGGAEAAIECRDGAALRGRDLRVRGALVGLRASGLDATLDLDGVTVLGAVSVGVASVDGARVRLQRSLVRDGENYGLFAGSSAGREAEPVGGRLHASDTLVAGHGGYGVVFAGAARLGAGAAACAGDPLAARGELDCLDRVAVQDNRTAGINLAGARHVDARRLVVTGTRADGDGLFGDGLFVGAGSRLTLDTDLVSDASRELGSQVIGNARTGILADGAAARLRVHGATVGSNRGPGVFLQRGAAGDAVSYSLLSGNGGVALGVTPGASLAAIQCDIFVGTRRATLASAAGERYELADGLSAYGLTGALVEGNVISRNERFGVVLLNAGGPGDRVVTLRGNRGEGNGFGFGNYNAMGVTVDAPGAIAGRSPAPTTAPRVAEAQGAR
jgi:hypothetical protein